MRILQFLLITLLPTILLAQDTASDQRFFRSNLYSKGDFEIHLFNNYYSQKEKLNQSAEYNSRYDFFTIIGQVLFGTNSKFNVGIDVYFRSVFQNLESADGKFNALKFSNEGFRITPNGNTGYSRVSFSLLGPKIKYQVLPRLGSFSMNHTLLLPIGSDLGGNNETGYLDWGSPVLMNQLYYDKKLSTDWSLFAELGLNIENINNAFLKKEDGFYQYSLPTTAILSYYPGSKWTFYGLLSYAARWENSVSNSEVNTNFNPYHQFGLGSKYWLGSNIELELLFTSFEDEVADRTASTFNLGIRYFSNR